MSERLYHVKSFEDFKSFLSLRPFKLGFELGGKGVQVDFFKKGLNCLCAHSCAEIVLIALTHIVVFLFGKELSLCQNGGGLTGVGYDILGEIKHFFKSFRGNIQHLTDTGGCAPEIPNVRNGGGKLNAAHTLTPYLAACYLNAAALAGLSLKAYFLVLSAGTFPVLGRSEYSFAEKSVSFGLLGAVVYGFGTGNHAVAPFSDLFGRSKTDFY